MEAEEICKLCEQVPLDRFLGAIEERADLAERKGELLHDYKWFLEKTALTTEELGEEFGTEESKAAMFSRARRFGDNVHQVLNEVSRTTGYRRYLMV